jgi:hypothetical protein
MSARIDALEHDKRTLEADNAAKVQENRELLEHLEQLNNTLAQSEAQVTTIEDTLLDAQREIRRLEHLAARTRDLEVQIEELNMEQIRLQTALVTSEADERNALRRWREAERRLSEMQDQLERIEREAREEREQHEEVVARMRKQKLVEFALESKGKTVKTQEAGPTVVSHFVKDILQDNVNLQMGISELREMLMQSNDEVQQLREQLLQHQPLGTDEAENEPPASAPHNTTPLRDELLAKDPMPISPEVHVHHHYHVPPKKEEVRRVIPKKKRNVSINLQNTPSRPSSRVSRHHSRHSSLAAAILSNTAITVPNPTNPKRWSMQSYGPPSDFASSAPSSPQSNFRNSILFDRMSIDQSADYSSRPTSPGSSIDPMSPMFRPINNKRASAISQLPAFDKEVIREEEDDDVPALQQLETPSTESDELSPVTGEDNSEQPNNVMEAHDDPFDPYTSYDPGPKLRRAASHESILSISGIDIHTLKSRPSQLQFAGSPALLRPRQLRSMPSTSFANVQPVFTSAETTPTISRQKYDSSSLLRSTMGLNNRPTSRESNTSTEATEPTPTQKRPGGWIFGRWGSSPTTSPASSATSTPAISVVDVEPPPLPKRQPQRRAVSTPIPRGDSLAVRGASADPLRLLMGRSPGINQKGPIPGFLKRPDRVPVQVTPARVDLEALREVLEE